VRDRAGEFASHRNPHQVRDLAALQGGFGFRGLLFGDIDKNSTQLVRSAVVMRMQASANADPAYLAVRLEHANVLGGGLLRAQRLTERGDGSRAVLWVDYCEQCVTRERYIST